MTPQTIEQFLTDANKARRDIMALGWEPDGESAFDRQLGSGVDLPNCRAVQGPFKTTFRNTWPEVLADVRKIREAME